MSYSLLLLNTDLHVAELQSRMSRGQFVRNTLAAIQMQLHQQPGSTSDLGNDDWSSVRGGSDVGDGAPNGRTIKRSDSLTSWSSVTREAFVSNLALRAPSTGQLTTGSTDTSSNTPSHTPLNDSALSVASSSREPKSSDNGSPVVYDRNWESEMESMLKVSSLTPNFRTLTDYACPGNIHFGQDSADLAADGQHDAGALLNFVAKSPRCCAEESKPPDAIFGSIDEFEAR